MVIQIWAREGTIEHVQDDRDLKESIYLSSEIKATI